MLFPLFAVTYSIATLHAAFVEIKRAYFLSHPRKIKYNKIKNKNKNALKHTLTIKVGHFGQHHPGSGNPEPVVQLEGAG